MMSKRKLQIEEKRETLRIHQTGECNDVEIEQTLHNVLCMCSSYLFTTILQK